MNDNGQPHGPAWWQADLGATATISAIKVWHRTDCCQVPRPPPRAAA